ncbi:MAG: leucine-rich repeat protein [Bacteroidales bacterium]|nr:leucine-rich repeat protein [Bacteroidales bacterium]
MMGKTKVKTFLISFLLAAVAACLSVALVACSGGGDDDKKSGNYGAGEEGIYYYDKDADTEYLMTLQSGVYMISMDGVSGYSGTYSYDEDAKSISFKTSDGATFAATFSNDAMQLAIEGEPYTFLKRVNYTVTFVDGNSRTTQSVVYGKSATAPETDPSRIFIGWYEDAAFSTQYRFDRAVTGDLTLYAYYIDVDSTIANFDVTFFMDEGTVYETTTQNGIIYDIPGVDGVLGWWISATGDPGALTYKYGGETLAESEKLFAVKEGSLGASIYDDRVTWEGSASSVTVTIEGMEPFTATGSPYYYDFSALSAGTYNITVEAQGYGEEELVYVSKALSRVSNFSVYGTTLVYNAVENAQYYCVSVICGNSSHDHEMVYNGNTLTYDFSGCEMGPDGISFTVYAYASGYVTSVSETYVYSLILDGTRVTIDEASDTAFWTPVTGAARYEVYVNGYLAATTTGTEYSFKYFGPGDIEVAIKPVAPGYYSEASAEAEYTKTTLAAPEIISVSDYHITWTEIVGAVSYELNINGNLVSVEPEGAGEDVPTTYILSDKDKESISDVNMNAISVTAIAENSSENSQQSDIYYMTDRVMSSALSYADGVITWDYALAADSYVVSYDGATETVAGVSTYDITFTRSGENEISVYFVLDGVQSAMAHISVTTYAVIFDSRGGDSVETMYVAKGDRLELEEPGYSIGRADFKGWYTLPDLTADENATTYAGGGVEYVSGDIFDCNGTLVLYAFWINQQVEVALHAGTYGEFRDENGNSLGSDVTAYISFGSRTFTLPVPVSSDPNTFFIGWYTAETGGVQYTDEEGAATTLYNNNSVTELYAHWGEAMSFDVVTYNGKQVLSVSAGRNISSLPGGVLTIPESYEVKGTVYTVGVINADAFNDCTKLTEINIPDTVMYIATVNAGYTSGSGAFAGCSNLKAVNIYATGVGNEDTAKEITYYSADGVLFEKDPSTDELTLIYYPHAKADASYTVPSTVGNDAEYAYEGNNVVKVEGHTVTKLATQALAAGTSSSSNRLLMTEVIIPATVKLVDAQCFYYSYNLEKVTFLEASAGASATLTIGDQAFARCTGLTDVTLPSHLTDFNTTMFDYCSALMSLKITAGGQYSATTASDASTEGLVCTNNGTTIIYCLRYCTGEVVIGNPVTTIGANAFNGCTRITSVIIGGTVTLIEESAFEGCTGIESITFLGDDNSNDLTIKTRAFYGLTNSAFTELYLPSNLITMEIYAFGGCTKLTTVHFDARKTAEGQEPQELNFATNAFANTAGNSYVTTLYLGENVPMFGFSGVFGKALTDVIIDENNKYFNLDDSGVIYSTDGTEILFYPDDLEGAYTVPDGVERIGDNVFSSRTNLTGIYIPSSVIYIGYQAFYGCSGLLVVEFDPADGEDLVIGDKAFYNCSKLTSISLPSRLVEMGEYDSMGNLVNMDVFTGCNNLATITVGEDNEHFMTSFGILYLIKDGEPTDLILSPRKNTAAQGELVIPSTVSKIWYRAFYYNEGITRISFENDTAVNGLELDSLITQYSEVKEIILPYGLEMIPYECFYYSRNLEYVYIPYTVTGIDVYAFYYCSALTDVVFGDVPEELAAQGVTAGDLEFGAFTYDYGGYYFSYTAITELVLPDRTTSLHRYAFCSISTLESVTIGSNIEEIPEWCFYNDKNLEEIIFAGGEDSKLRSIGQYAFTQTGTYDLILPANLEEIENYAFSSYSNESANYNGAGVTSVKFNKNLKTIGDYAFYSCKSLESIEFEEVGELDMTLELKLGRNVFYNSKITSVTFPYYVTQIGGFNYVKITEVNFADVPDEYLNGTEDGQEGHKFVIGTYAFYSNTAMTSINIPAYISSIESYAFYGCTALTAVAFGDGMEKSILETIGDYAFYNCKVLTSIEFPATLKTIGATSFYGTKALKTVTFAVEAASGYASLEEIKKNAFQNSGITAFVFPEVELTTSFTGITLGDAIFKGCSYLTSVTLSNAVTDLGTAFSGCFSITEIKISETNSSFKAAESNSQILYSADGTSIVYVCGEIKGELGIEDGVMVIEDGVFQYQNTLTSVTIPATVTKIGDYAFYGCTALTSVTFKANTDPTLTSALTSLGKGAFMYCTALKQIDLPSSITAFSTYTFYGCSALEEITIPSEVALNDSTLTGTTNARNYSYDFYNCTSLKKVIFEGVPAEIGSNAFYGCTALTTIGTSGQYTEGVFDLSALSETYFGDSAFLGTGVTKVILPARDFTAAYSTTKMTKTFRECLSLEEIGFASDGATTLCSAMFYGCSALEKVEFNEGVTIYTGTSNSTGVFINCTSLETVITGGSTIQPYTFYGCTALKTIVDSESDLATMEGIADLRTNTDIKNGKYTFHSCESLSFVILPDGCSLPTYIFYDTISLKTVTGAADYAAGCYTEGVADLSSVAEIGDYAFYRSGIEELIFPAGKATTGAFMGCESLKSITFCSGAISLGKAAFADCTSLETVTIRADMTLTAGSSTSGANVGAFGGSGVKTVLLDGVTSFVNYMFVGCANLTTVASVTDANYTTDTNGNKILNESTINFGVVDLTGLSSVGTYAFCNCSAITTVVYPSTYTTTSNYEFDGCTSLTTFAVLAADEDGKYDFDEVEEGVVDLSSITTMGTYLFRNCESITKVILPTTVTTITTYAFYGCSNLVTIGGADTDEGHADLTGVKAINSYAFTGAGIKDLTLGQNTNSSTSYYAQFADCLQLEKVTLTTDININRAMFAGCTSLKEVIAADGADVTATVTAGTSLTTTQSRGAFADCGSFETFAVTAAAINAYTFANCCSLKSIDLSSYSTIGNYAFYNCSSLANVDLSSATSVGSYSFYGCSSLASVGLSTVTSIEEYAFYGAGLTSVTIPASLDTIGTCAFNCCTSLTSVSVENGNNRYRIEDDLVIDYVDMAVVYCPGGITNVVVPEGVVTISEYAFYGSNVSSVTLATTVKTIEQYAFAGCAATEVDLSGCGVLETIGNYAFYLTCVEHFDIPASVATIGDYAFAGVLTATASTTSSSITVTQQSALKSITFFENDGEGEEEIEEVELTVGSYAFAATSLTSLEIPDRVVSFGTYALAGTLNMEEIVFGAGLTSLPTGFGFGSGIVTMEIPGNITALGTYCFWGCKNLKNLTLDEGLETIETYNFTYCESLEELYLPSTITEMKIRSFGNCTALKTVVLADGSTVLGTGNYVFEESTALESVILPDSLTSINGYAFQNSGLKSIIIPANVSSMGTGVFTGWTSDRVIYLELESEFASLHVLGNSYTTSTGTTLGYEQWRDGCEALICYYSESEPAANTGLTYWHYDTDGVTPVVWSV